MEEMIEPDRTIMIVSIIGLVIIWGSVAYRKFAQNGGSATHESMQSGSSDSNNSSAGSEKK